MTSSLEELRARARAMEAGLEERDALLRELSRKPEAHEDSRARAEQLRLIIGDPWLGGFQGSDGRRVDRAAVQALRALGEPYASEPVPSLPAEPLEGPSQLPAPQASTLDPGWLGRILALLLGCFELLVTFFLSSLDGHVSAFSVFITGVILSSLFLPVLLPRAPRHSPLDLLRRFGMVSLAAVTGGWSVLALAAIVFSTGKSADPVAIVLFSAMALLHGTILSSLSRVLPLEGKGNEGTLNEGKTDGLEGGGGPLA